jgi:hypothetical protein
VVLILHLHQAPLMPLRVVQVPQALIQLPLVVLVREVQVVLVRRQMPLERPLVS